MYRCPMPLVSLSGAGSLWLIHAACNRAKRQRVVVARQRKVLIHVDDLALLIGQLGPIRGKRLLHKLERDDALSLTQTLGHLL